MYSGREKVKLVDNFIFLGSEVDKDAQPAREEEIFWKGCQRQI